MRKVWITLAVLAVLVIGVIAGVVGTAMHDSFSASSTQMHGTASGRPTTCLTRKNEWVKISSPRQTRTRVAYGSTVTIKGSFCLPVGHGVQMFDFSKGVYVRDTPDFTLTGGKWGSRSTFLDSDDDIGDRVRREALQVVLVDAKGCKADNWAVSEGASKLPPSCKVLARVHFEVVGG